jgi:hypothetical protein
VTISPGDVIEWRTWCGPTRATVEWIDRFGHCGIRSSDSHSEYFETVPRGAVVVDVP